MGKAYLWMLRGILMAPPWISLVLVQFANVHVTSLALVTRCEIFYLRKQKKLRE
jgi:hypothetical protein